MSEENQSPDVPESGIADGSTPFAGWGADAQSSTEAPKKKRRKGRRSEEAGGLSINSLMDVVTIILVYLIKSFATSPIEVKDPSIDLPASTSKESIEEAAVVMVTGPIMKYTDENRRTALRPNIPSLLVDGRPLFNLEPAASADGKSGTFRIPAAQKSPPDPNSFVVSSLLAELEAARKKQEATAALMEQDFTGKVVIIADKQTPYRVLMDLLVTCGQAGFGEFKFAIVKDQG